MPSDDSPPPPPAFKKGILVTGGGLHREEAKILLTENKVSITDGPILEGKELIPGFTVIKVDNKEQAIEWVKTLRRLYGDGETKLVQIFGAS